MITTSPAVPLVTLDRDAFKANFEKNAYTVSHGLADHPLFTIPRLVRLASALPVDRVEYNAGNIPISQDPNVTPRNGLSPEETIRRIEECSSWLVLKNVERDPEYAELVHGCLEAIRELSENEFPGMSEREGFIFISSPRSVTPFHIDPEHNYLLQVRGTKSFHAWHRLDREVLSEHEIENFFYGAHRNLPFEESFQSRAREFHLEPGMGVHVPVATPHWVQNGSAVSVSFSITFRSRFSQAMANAYRFNHRLRRWGLTPSPYGRRPALDRTKQLANRVLTRIEQMMPGYERERASNFEGEAM